MDKPKKIKRFLFRANAIYTTGRPTCAFVKAVDKEDAYKFVDALFKENMKKAGMPEGKLVKIEITPASQGEMDFFVENVQNRTYTGLVN